MKFETARLIIRPLGLEDLNDFHAYRSDPEVARFQGYEPMSESECAKYLTKNVQTEFGVAGKWKQFALELKSEQKVIGDLGVHFREKDPKTCELGVSLNRNYQRQGFAKETMSIVLEHLFSNLKIHRVAERLDSENEDSIKLLESIGFRKEAFFLENYFSDGQWRSELQYALLHREWSRNSKV